MHGPGHHLPEGHLGEAQRAWCPHTLSRCQKEEKDPQAPVPPIPESLCHLANTPSTPPFLNFPDSPEGLLLLRLSHSPSHPCPRRPHIGPRPLPPPLARSDRRSPRTTALKPAPWVQITFEMDRNTPRNLSICPTGRGQCPRHLSRERQSVVSTHSLGLRFT